MRCLVFSLLALLMGVGLPAGGGATRADLKSAELQRLSQEISRLRFEIQQKLDGAERVRGSLEELRAQYAEEIRAEKARWRYATYRSAVANPRIANDLRLIQQLAAYLDRLAARIDFFRHAQATLEFYQQRISDDLMMIRTLDDFAVDRLVEELNSVLDAYVPAAARKIVRLDDLQLADMELLWQQVVK